MYIQTSRLDLDDLNSDSEDGLHITSMAGTWMSVVKGFGGFRVKDGKIELQPMIPTQWNAYTFTIKFRGALIRVKVSKTEVKIQNDSSEDVEVVVFGKAKSIKANSSGKVKFPDSKKDFAIA